METVVGVGLGGLRGGGKVVRTLRVRLLIPRHRIGNMRTTLLAWDSWAEAVGRAARTKEGRF